VPCHVRQRFLNDPVGRHLQSAISPTGPSPAAAWPGSLICLSKCRTSSSADRLALSIAARAARASPGRSSSTSLATRTARRSCSGCARRRHARPWTAAVAPRRGSAPRSPRLAAPPGRPGCDGNCAGYGPQSSSTRCAQRSGPCAEWSETGLRAFARRSIPDCRHSDAERHERGAQCRDRAEAPANN
jgi:hypothetical protein